MVQNELQIYVHYQKSIDNFFQFDNPAKQMLKDSIQSQYKGLNGTNVVSIGWNFVAQKVCLSYIEYI